MNKPRIVTIGVYGYDEDEFFKVLQDAHVDTFCDVRRRRGVRGARYAFANSQRLQARLAESGIRYIHRIDLSPSNAARSIQYAADAHKIAKRQREVIDPGFAAAYEQEVLAHFSAEEFLAALPEDAEVVALFCVERVPEACHRSLLAARLADDLGLDVEHVR